MGKAARKKMIEENGSLKNKNEELKAEIEALKAENLRLENDKEGLNVTIMALTTENEKVRKERTEVELKNKLEVEKMVLLKSKYEETCMELREKIHRQEELMKEMLDKVDGENYRKLVVEINGKIEQLKKSICDKDETIKELGEDIIRLAHLAGGR